MAYALDSTPVPRLYLVYDGPPQCRHHLGANVVEGRQKRNVDHLSFTKMFAIDSSVVRAVGSSGNDRRHLVVAGSNPARRREFSFSYEFGGGGTCTAGLRVRWPGAIVRPPLAPLPPGVSAKKTPVQFARWGGGVPTNNRRRKRRMGSSVTVVVASGLPAAGTFASRRTGRRRAAERAPPPPL